MEERRYNIDEASFGNCESRQLDIVREIVDKTGCDIEMSQTKDRALTIMVTGKPSSVLKARKDLLQKLQTQVSNSVGRFFFLIQALYERLWGSSLIYGFLYGRVEPLYCGTPLG